MAGSVNGIACNVVAAAPGKQSPQEKMEVFSPAGSDGYGVRRLGVGQAPFGFRLMLEDTQANVETWYQNIVASKPGPIDIVDDWGTTHTLMQIQTVSQLTRRPAIRGAFVGVHGSCRITGVQTAIPASP